MSDVYIVIVCYYEPYNSTSKLYVWYQRMACIIITLALASGYQWHYLLAWTGWTCCWYLLFCCCWFSGLEKLRLGFARPIEQVRLPVDDVYVPAAQLLYAQSIPLLYLQPMQEFLLMSRSDPGLVAMVSFVFFYFFSCNACLFALLFAHWHDSKQQDRRESAATFTKVNFVDQ